MNQEDLELWKNYKRDPKDTEMRNRLIDRYFHTVEYQAQKLASRLKPSAVFDYDDLVSAGFFGMLEAFDSFSLDKGFKFETFATFRIRGAMIDEVRRLDQVARKTRGHESSRIAAESELAQTLGREPTAEEVAQELGFDENAAKQLAACIPPGNDSLETPLFDDGRVMTYRDMLQGREPQPDRRSIEADQMRLITRSLGDHERMVVLLYYYQGLTMREIGKSLGISESRVSQLHSYIVAKLEGVLANRRDELFEE